MNQTNEAASGYAMSEGAWLRLQASAAAVCVRVWREGDRMFAQRPGGEPQEFVCDTLKSAGIMRCPRRGDTCQADAHNRQIGRRVVCTPCGTLSKWMSPAALTQAAKKAQR